MSPLTRLIASFIALVMAMGIGRFSLTPQLPHLISEGQIDLTGAGLIAAANYLGYLVGALDAMRAKRPEQVQARLHIGLWLCVGLTLVSFWAHGFWPHLLLRFGAGIASAWVMVMIASLSQQLAVSANRPRLGALVFAGPGVGVLLTGLLALVSNLYGQSSATLWLIYAAAALIMVLGISPLLPKPAALPVQAPIAPRAARQPGISRLGAIYGLYGLGYIIPATFLSQMASAQFHGQWQADLFWPAFGLCAAIGVVLISVRRPDPDTTRWWLMGALWVQALGVLACLLPSGAGLALGVILCGTPFLACMPLVMQSSRDLAPHATQRNAALLTACFAVGQLCGPLLAALSSQLTPRAVKIGAV
ncbi:YbfB/YjiJ family MFS transporter [Pseudomonas helleri]|uniref:YbfB/YjiJ family MFS transporter n=1 Tax=Pseudomonas helleri TaxID=1608996 RepID=A0ABW9PLM6_9PSED|nr:YbfB/YjiJ family MFS transporter [Pseudomonas helleri]